MITISKGIWYQLSKSIWENILCETMEFKEKDDFLSEKSVFILTTYSILEIRNSRAAKINEKNLGEFPNAFIFQQ